MKVIVYINEPSELRHCEASLKWALAEPTLKNGGAVHTDDKVSFFEKRSSGTVVIRVAKQEKEPA